MRPPRKPQGTWNNPRSPAREGTSPGNPPGPAGFGQTSHVARTDPKRCTPRGRAAASGQPRPQALFTAFRRRRSRSLVNAWAHRWVRKLNKAIRPGRRAARSSRPFQPSVEALEVRLTPSTVTTTADSGAGSLRQAILDANAVAGP